MRNSSLKELKDTEVMYLHAHGPGLIHTKGKAVKKIEDMKGLKLRGHGTSAKVVKALGGTPVPKPMPETYQMIQKGVVDGGVSRLRLIRAGDWEKLPIILLPIFPQPIPPPSLWS